MLAAIGVLTAALCLVSIAAQVLWLRRAARPAAGRGAPDRSREPDWPPVDVIVPVHDEAAWIEDKLRDVATLDYPTACLRVWVVDGASTDGTADLARRWVSADERFHLLRLPVAHKTAQLNAALRRSTAEWVLVTDADARLPRETLRALIGTALVDPSLGALGSLVEPVTAHPLEHLHWSLSNGVRRAEAAAGCASMVAAPCYLVRRAIVPSLPGDVVADDVHVALASCAAGWRTGLVEARVRELRTPVRLTELFGHKVRKTEFYIRELLRFLPSIGRMQPLARLLLLSRLAHLTLLPVLGVVAAIATSLFLWPPLVPLGLLLTAGLMAAPVARQLPPLVLLPSLVLLLDTAALVALGRIVLGRRLARRVAARPTPVRIRGGS